MLLTLSIRSSRKIEIVDRVDSESLDSETAILSSIVEDKALVLAERRRNRAWEA